MMQGSTNNLEMVMEPNGQQQDIQGTPDRIHTQPEPGRETPCAQPACKSQALALALLARTRSNQEKHASNPGTNRGPTLPN